MRELKFKAINANGKWIYGLPYTDGTNDTYYHKEFSNRLCWRGENGAHCNQPYRNGTLVQYTGLKEKNGDEAYHKDIFDNGFKDKWIMEWSDNDAGFRLESILGYDPLPARKVHEMIKCGTTYENPELVSTT